MPMEPYNNQNKSKLASMESNKNTNGVSSSSLLQHVYFPNAINFQSENGSSNINSPF